VLQILNVILTVTK